MIRFLACCFVTFCISSAILLLLLLLLYNYLRRKVEENLIDKKSYNFVLRTLIYSVLKFVHIPFSSALYYVTIESLSEWRWRARLNKVIHQSNFFLTDLFLAIYFFHFQKKVKYSTSILKTDCSLLSFEVHNVCVAQNLRISEFLIEFFFAWTLATSATSRGRNFNLSNLNRVSNFSSRPKLSYETLFVAQKWNWEELDNVFSIRAESAPARVSRRPKSPGVLGLTALLMATSMRTRTVKPLNG